MAEVFTLTTPEAKPSTTTYQIAGIYETWLPVGSEQVEIRLLGTNGEVKSAIYGPNGLMKPDGILVPTALTGQAILRAQNKMNFSVTSRQKKIYQQLQTDGVLVGNITGVPD